MLIFDKNLFRTVLLLDVIIRYGKEEFIIIRRRKYCILSALVLLNFTMNSEYIYKLLVNGENNKKVHGVGQILNDMKRTNRIKHSRSDDRRYDESEVVST